MIKNIIIGTLITSFLFTSLALSIYITFTHIVKLKKQDKYMLAIITLSIIAFMIIYNMLFNEPMVR